MEESPAGLPSLRLVDDWGNGQSSESRGGCRPRPGWISTRQASATFKGAGSSGLHSLVMSPPSTCSNPSRTVAESKRRLAIISISVCGSLGRPRATLAPVRAFESRQLVAAPNRWCRGRVLGYPSHSGLAAPTRAKGDKQRLDVHVGIGEVFLPDNALTLVSRSGSDRRPRRSPAVARCRPTTPRKCRHRPPVQGETPLHFQCPLSPPVPSQSSCTRRRWSERPT